jgi:hypothetical protein
LTGPIVPACLFENLRSVLPVVANWAGWPGLLTPGIDALIHIGDLLSGDDF